MGFPSPATDYIEDDLNLNTLMVSRPSATLCVKTLEGFVLIDKSLKPIDGDRVYIEAFGLFQLAILGKGYFVCQDGETIEGAAAEEVTVVGVMTWEVICQHEDSRPTI